MNSLTETFFFTRQVIMVCISDGRANVPLSVSNGEPVSVLPSVRNMQFFGLAEQAEK